MKKLILLIICTAAGFAGISQQVTLYDSTGEKIAYIDYENESTVFLWDGTPVAFLENIDGNLCVYGFNHEFLGWYENDFLYNIQGYKAGTIREPKNKRIGIDPIKGIQHITPIKPILPLTQPRKPRKWEKEWSGTTLEDFLKGGKK